MEVSARVQYGIEQGVLGAVLASKNRHRNGSIRAPVGFPRSDRIILVTRRTTKSGGDAEAVSEVKVGASPKTKWEKRNTVARGGNT